MPEPVTLGMQAWMDECYFFFFFQEEGKNQSLTCALLCAPGSYELLRLGSLVIWLLDGFSQWEELAGGLGKAGEKRNKGM